jgi:gamma-glutamylcyclotransferase (GGCT)/AIG2-like uncharacterized protein YtfP
MQVVPVFVYGSLKKDFRHASVVASAERVGDVEAAPFELVRYGEYPAMVRAAEGVVCGELLLVDKLLLHVLDEFEDCPQLYQRHQIRLTSGRGAFAYLISPQQANGCERIEGGVWREVP